MATVAVGARGRRRYGLYLSETQDLADKHVETIGAMLEKPPFATYYPDMASRAVGKYGSSRGWRRNRLHTASGFVVDALGLDVAARGIKVEDARPDWLVIDDIDSEDDTPGAVEKKITTLSKKILPAGTPDLAVLFGQNVIHAGSVMNRLLTGELDILADRIMSGPYAALENPQFRSEGTRHYIVAGEPTWAGQGLVECQRYIDTWGFASFLSECQQEISMAGQYFGTWDEAIHTCEPFDIPGNWPVWAALDWGYNHPTAVYMFTEGDGMLSVIAEHVEREWLPAQHCVAIRKKLMSLGIAITRLRQIVAGHDAFEGKKDSQGKTIADQYAEATDPDTGVPVGLTLSRAQNDRVSGWLACRSLLGDPQRGLAPSIQIFKTCPRLIAKIPKARRDPTRPEDVLKMDANSKGLGGDDELDSWRYGAMARPKRAPVVAPISIPKRMEDRWR